MNLSDVNVEDITKTLSEHQNTLIKIALVVVCLGLAVMMFTDHHKKETAIHQQISQAQAKLDAIKSRDTSIQSFKDFQASLLKPVNEVEMISLVNNYAKENHVTIASLNPSEGRNLGLYDQINLSFSAHCDDFRTLMLFLRKIERSPSPLRIDSWSGHEEEDGKIVFDVNISAVLIHS